MAAVLDDLREVVDEIIVAADTRVAAVDLGHYAKVADRLLRYQHAGANRHWPWLAAQAAGDWLFLLDGDELPSMALVSALQELVADRRIGQYSLPIHWLWPRASAHLVDEPWNSDRRLRLVRAPGLTFGARKHVLADPGGPVSFRDDLPVYHLELLLPDVARRTDKVARCDAERFGILTPEGLPFNEAFYFPENAGHEPSTIPLPIEDAQRAERALRATPDPGTSLDPQIVTVHADEIIQHAPGSALPSDAYRASLSLARPLPSFIAERRHQVVWVHVVNNGTVRFPGGEHEPLIRLGARWQPVDGGEQVDVNRASLPHPLEPGEGLLMPVEVCAPPLAGPAGLVLDLVHEHIRWFDQPLRSRVDVEESVANRLRALVTSFGALIPLEEVIRLRRAVASRDGLVRTGTLPIRPAEREIDEVTRGLVIDGWTLDGETIDRLVEVVRAQTPRTVVEFGSGTSTIVLASLLADTDGARVISFDGNNHWADRTSDTLRARGLDHVAVVNALPLINGRGAPMSFGLTAEAERLLRRHPPDLALVDGPTLESGASRLGALDILSPFVRTDLTVLLDDALRDAELCVASEWKKRADLSVHGIRATPKGLLEATLHPRMRTPAKRHGRFLGRIRG